MAEVTYDFDESVFSFGIGGGGSLPLPIASAGADAMVVWRIGRDQPPDMGYRVRVTTGYSGMAAGEEISVSTSVWLTDVARGRRR